MYGQVKAVFQHTKQMLHMSIFQNNFLNEI